MIDKDFDYYLKNKFLDNTKKIKVFNKIPNLKEENLNEEEYYLLLSLLNTINRFYLYPDLSKDDIKNTRYRQSLNSYFKNYGWLGIGQVIHYLEKYKKKEIPEVEKKYLEEKENFKRKMLLYEKKQHKSLIQKLNKYPEKLYNQNYSIVRRELLRYGEDGIFNTTYAFYIIMATYARKFLKGKGWEVDYTSKNSIYFTKNDNKLRFSTHYLPDTEKRRYNDSIKRNNGSNMEFIVDDLLTPIQLEKILLKFNKDAK